MPTILKDQVSRCFRGIKRFYINAKRGSVPAMCRSPPILQQIAVGELAVRQADTTQTIPKRELTVTLVKFERSLRWDRLGCMGIDSPR
jgi:hypothetical protein